MTILAKIQIEYKNLRKARSALVPTVAFHISEISKIGKDVANRETTENETIQYLKKTVTKLKDANASREEINFLEQFLPDMISVDTVLESLVLDGVDISNKGAVMKAAKAKYGNLVDYKALGAAI